MEFQKIVNFLDITSDNKDLPRYVTKKWIDFYDQSQGNYKVNKEIRIKTSMLRSDLSDFSDAYIVAKGNITVTEKAITADNIEAPNNTVANASASNTANDNAFGKKKLVFINNASFINCISKINGVKIDNAEDLDVIMPMYNLLEYSKNYRKTGGSLRNYHRDDTNSSTDNDNITRSTRQANCSASPNVYEIDNPQNATFKITGTKLYVPVVTLAKENDIKLLEQLKSGFKRTIKWNKYRSKMTVQPQNNNLKYLIDPKFMNVSRLFVLSFPRNNNTDSRYSFSNYYIPKVRVNDFNVLIDGKSVFDLPVKNEEEAYQNIIDNNGYPTGNLLDFPYYKKH